MPRPPKPSSIQLIIRAKPEWEVEFRAFKELCARNGIQYSQEIYERAIRPFLRDHNWPPGNSQTVLNGFVPPIVTVCETKNCNAEAIYELHFPHKPTRKVCPSCLKEQKRKKRRVGWRRLRKTSIDRSSGAEVAVNP